MNLTVADVRELILRDNPAVRADECEHYAQQFMLYAEAVENITANGIIVAHPRTGAPIDNPYGRVMDSSQRAMARLGGRWTLARLWEKFAAECDKG